MTDYHTRAIRRTFRVAIILLIVAGSYTAGVFVYTVGSLIFSGPPSEHRTVELDLDYGTPCPRPCRYPHLQGG